MNEPLKNPTPAQRFRESSDNISKHRDMVDSREFQRAVDYGLLEYQHTLCNNIPDGNTAVGVGLRMLGATEIIRLIRNLSETAPPKPTIIQAGLDHKA